MIPEMVRHVDCDISDILDKIQTLFCQSVHDSPVGNDELKPGGERLQRFPVDKSSMLYRFKRWCYYKSYFPELGLRKDDITMEGPVMGPILQEALRRIPKHELDGRNFRIMRANQLSMMKQVLPRDQWTVYEEDTPYLQPYIDEVMKEMEERKEWDSK